jgi:transglutaminase-like putative cysteine protease/predicted glutamine amidotransferase
MPNLFAMSFEGELAPSFDLRCLHPGRKTPDGWGLGYYPGGEPSAVVLKEPAPPHGSIRSELIRAWEHLASSIFVVHIRSATWGQISDANTQPFSRSFRGRDWLFAHSGSLRERLELPAGARFDPVGSTDTELIFCGLLNQIFEGGWRSLGDIPPELLRGWLEELNSHGSLTSVLTDGRDMCVYADIEGGAAAGGAGGNAGGDGGVHVFELLPPHGHLQFADGDLEIDLTSRGLKSRKGVLVSSTPMEPSAAIHGSWRRLPPGHLVVVRQGAVRHVVERPRAAQVAVPGQDAGGGGSDGSAGRGGAGRPLPDDVPQLRGRPVLPDPKQAEVRRLRIDHRTTYRYDKPVERSTHVLRLTPVHDRLQRLLESELHVFVDEGKGRVPVSGPSRDFDDVFGNRVRRLLIDSPFRELTIQATSTVELRDVDPLGFRERHVRSTIPLVWMPWQRHMLQPFLLPAELPESELEELVEYAMSFAERNGYDLLDTLLDLNTSIFKEYEYRQGSTTLGTTPFETYVNRRGVCQDFTNLFICLARLLGVPARYTCGYIYTGPKNANQRQGEASHAWVQVYLPEAGWKGFDPTNGITTQTDHVRLAVGRSYVDATPTSGTIYLGGGLETLEVEVRCEPCD